MIVPVLGILLVLVAISTWSSWRARTQLLARLRAEWGHFLDRPRDMEAIADLFRSHDDARGFLDDRTWNDLLLDDVFRWLDRVQSSVGQQVLYRRLRSAPAPHSLDAFEALTRLGDDPRSREQAQTALARLRDPAAYYLHRLTLPDALTRRWWHIVFPIWSLAVMLTLSLAFIWPSLLLVVVFGLVANFVIRIATGRRVGGEIVWFRQLGPLLSTARELVPCCTDGTAAITGLLKVGPGRASSARGYCALGES